MAISLTLSTSLSIAGLAYLILQAIYRIAFHPLTRFPGPKLAAVTNLYAASYDLSGKESLVKHLKRLHDEYGPIVRLRPNELHIWDWESYRTVFKQGTEFDKPPEFYNVPQVEGSFLCTSSASDAKPHRDLFVQAFSRSNIDKLESLIHEKLNLFLDRLAEAASHGKSVDLDYALNCLTADVTMHYSYQKSLELLNAPDFQAPMIIQLREFSPVVPFFWYFPNVSIVMNKVIFKMLPMSIVKVLFPAAASMLSMMAQSHELIRSLSKLPPDSKDVQQSIFSKALNPDREKGQYVASDKELAADAVLVFLAGTDTTAHTLTSGIWQMVKNPQLWSRLQQEVKSISPEIHSMTAVRTLETLPFLKAVIKESLRFSLGTTARLPRIVPPHGRVLCNEQIPAGTRVSFCHYVYNNDPSIFPQPHIFNPDRWIVTPENPQSAVDRLESHMISFSRGSRSCIGMNLAYAELYSAFAHIAKRFTVVNDGTTDHDMDWIDTFTPRTKGHLRVKLSPVRH